MMGRISRLNRFDKECGPYFADEERPEVAVKCFVPGRVQQDAMLTPARVDSVVFRTKLERLAVELAGEYASRG